MRKNFLKNAAVFGAVALGLVAVGCASQHQSTASSAMKGQGTVLIHSVHGQVGVYTAGQGGTPVGEFEPGYERCAECEKDVKTYYMTGMIDPVCKVCGAKRVVLQQPMGGGHGHQ